MLSGEKRTFLEVTSYFNRNTFIEISSFSDIELGLGFSFLLNCFELELTLSFNYCNYKFCVISINE